ncbi:MAG: hypothetical protein V3V92_03575, partial [Candidatus Hydrothermarchaeales archaeon]
MADERSLRIKEYTSVTEVAGPLMVVEGIEAVGYGEVVNIETVDGEKRRGQVLEAAEGRAVVQVFEGTRGIDTSKTKVR